MAEEISERVHDPVHFRRVLGHYPTGVSVITALDGERGPQGMVVGSFTSVSMDPPLVAFFATDTLRTTPKSGPRADSVSTCLRRRPERVGTVPLIFPRGLVIAGYTVKVKFELDWDGAPSFIDSALSYTHSHCSSVIFNFLPTVVVREPPDRRCRGPALVWRSCFTQVVLSIGLSECGFVVQPLHDPGLDDRHRRYHRTSAADRVGPQQSSNVSAQQWKRLDSLPWAAGSWRQDRATASTMQPMVTVASLLAGLANGYVPEHPCSATGSGFVSSPS